MITTTTSFSAFTAHLREFIRCGKCDQDFESLALNLFGLQFEHNAPYRNLCEARNLTPDRINHWSEIPTVPTQAFKELDLTCLEPGERTTAFYSSGTTAQQRSRHFHSSESLKLYEVSLLKWFEMNVLNQWARGRTATSRLRMICLTPGAPAAPYSSLVHMFETVRRECGAKDSTFLGSATATADWVLNSRTAVPELQLASESGVPVLLMGTAFSFVHLLDILAATNQRLHLPPGSLALETGGYKGRSRSLPKGELHRLIATWLGISRSSIVCEYGMSELSSQAYGSEAAVERGERQASPHSTPGARHPTVFHFPPWARAQIISPETGHEVNNGETGLIRVFDLANVYSVMAVQTEDLGIRRGDGFELIGRASFAEARGCSLMAI